MSFFEIAAVRCSSSYCTKDLDRRSELLNNLLDIFFLENSDIEGAKLTATGVWNRSIAMQ